MKKLLIVIFVVTSLSSFATCKIAVKGMGNLSYINEKLLVNGLSELGFDVVD